MNRDRTAFPRDSYSYDPSNEESTLGNDQSAFHTTSEGDDSVTSLHYLCAKATEDVKSWDPVRRWLRTHNDDEKRQAAEILGEANTIPLHQACRNRPPADVVQALLRASPDTVRWGDSYGLLPLHYACANGAAEDVLRLLAEAYPDGKMAVESRGMTPLHSCLCSPARVATPATVALLGSMGAATVADKQGMIPLHYACAFGASEDVLRVLTDRRTDSIATKDKRGWTSLHLAMANADRNPASPDVVGILLSQNKEVVNIADNEGGLPLHRLAARAHNLTEDQKRERNCAEKCFLLYLEARPKSSPVFLTALQALPSWLHDRAVVHPVVQELINARMARRFPTFIVLLDFWFLLAILITYSIMVQRSARYWDDREKGKLVLAPLYLGAVWFIFREVVQMVSLKALGHFHTWLYDPTNWMDCAFIIVVVAGIVHMQTRLGDMYAFRTWTFLSLLILWLNIMSFLKNFFLDFAVFVNGVLFVVKHLITFLMALFIIAWAFAHVFYLLFLETGYCRDGSDSSDPQPFCDIVRSFLKVYTMLLGEVDDSLFKVAQPMWFALLLFTVFMFLVVILLANVLIAIVTDSYGVIRHERAAMVFWSNRLDFVMEMDAIRTATRPFTKSILGLLGMGGARSNRLTFEDILSDVWRMLMELFEDDTNQKRAPTGILWIMSLRLFAVTFIPFWLAIGFLTAGLFWPPQVRSHLFVLSLNPGSHKEAEERTKEIAELWKEMEEHKDNIGSDIAVIRADVAAVKAQLADMKSDITDQMDEIKEIVNTLFHLQTSAYG